MPASLTILLDDDTFAKLDALASETNRPRDWHIIRAIEDYVEVSTWQVASIKEGIAQADRGEFATDEEVNAVFTGLRAKLRDPSAGNGP